MARHLPDVSARAWRVYDHALVIDMHNDMPTKVLDEGYDPDVRHPSGVGVGVGHTDLPRLIESGLTAVFLAAWVHASFAAETPDGSYARAVAGLDVIRQLVARHPERLLAGRVAADVRTAKASGRIAVYMGVEGGHAIEGSLDRLRALYAMGVRYLTLTWNNGNSWAGSSVGVGGTRTEGLTAFGREVIAEMNRMGMIVDVSHVSDATLADVLAVSVSPVIASHSNARALHDHRRNLTDAQLRGVAATGGVVNVNFFSRFLDPGFREEAPTPVPLSVLIGHIDHIASVAGIEHVGLGSDFDGMSAVPVGLEDVSAVPRIADALLGRGYTDDDVGRVLGGNMLRVMERVLPGVTP
jgi:membrane dipeptidase